MKEQEALEIIKSGDKDFNNFYRALAVAVEALEKQIPKSAIIKPAKGIHRKAYCPTCGKELFAWNWQTMRCNCGQKI